MPAIHYHNSTNNVVGMTATNMTRAMRRFCLQNGTLVRNCSSHVIQVHIAPGHKNMSFLKFTSPEHMKLFFNRIMNRLHRFAFRFTNENATAGLNAGNSTSIANSTNLAARSLEGTQVRPAETHYVAEIFYWVSLIAMVLVAVLVLFGLTSENPARRDYQKIEKIDVEQVAKQQDL